MNWRLSAMKGYARENSFVLRQPCYGTVGRNIYPFGGWHFAEAWHEHYISGDGHDKASTALIHYVPYVHGETRGTGKLFCVVREGILRLCNNYGQPAYAVRLEVFDRLLAALGLSDPVTAVNFGNDIVDFGLCVVG